MSSGRMSPSLPEAKLRLGSVLARLERAVRKTRTADQHAREQFVAWHAQWASRKEQIAKRLALIDSEIHRLALQTPATPQLLVVDSPSRG